MQDLEFQEWFDIFQEKVRKLGYTGPIDKYSFEWNWEENEVPEKCAEDFVKEMTE